MLAISADRFYKTGRENTRTQPPPPPPHTHTHARMHARTRTHARTHARTHTHMVALFVYMARSSRCIKNMLLTNRKQQQQQRPSSFSSLIQYPISVCLPKREGFERLPLRSNTVERNFLASHNTPLNIGHFVLDFNKMRLKDLATHNKFKVRRRPQFQLRNNESEPEDG